MGVVDGWIPEMGSVPPSHSVRCAGTVGAAGGWGGYGCGKKKELT